MEDVIKWMAFAIQMLPVVLQGILLAESTIGSGNGQAKKQLVMNTLIPGPAVTLNKEVVPVVSQIIDQSVGPLTLAKKLRPHTSPSAPTVR